jgi:phosphoglycerate dehydrogenase-like enzyme
LNFDVSQGDMTQFVAGPANASSEGFAASAPLVVFHDMARTDEADHERRVRALADRFGGRLRFLALARDAGVEAVRAAYADAEVLVTRRLAGGVPLPALRLLQVPASGHDTLDLASVPPACVVCNVASHDIPIAEYVMAALLEWNIGLASVANAFRAGRWAGSAAGSPPHGELHGRTLCLFGVGGVGRAIAARARAFGMRVEGYARSGRGDCADVDRWHGRDGLAAFLAAADFLVLACPLTDETRGLVDATFLAGLRPSAVLVNVARAAVVDEADLYDALHDGRLGGAIIDVWWTYPGPDDPAPRPAALPFHQLSNVLMTPHIASWSDAYVERRWEAIARNLERYLAGADLENVVRPTAAPR